MMWIGRRSMVSSALVLVAALAGGCGSDGGGDGGGNGNGGDGGADEPYEVDLTLVDVLAADDSGRVARSHEIRFYDSAALDLDNPLVTTMSEETTGKVMATIPAGVATSAIHIIGSGEGDSDTYDSFILNEPRNSGEQLLRVSSNGLASAAGNVAMFDEMADRASFSGAVYWTPEGNLRKGTVACAVLFLDDATTSLDMNTDQRYNAESGLPAPATGAAAQTETASAGRFFFGNMTVGDHTLRVEVAGETVATVEFTVPLAREDAVGPSKLILYQIGIDVRLPENPGC